MKLKWIILLTFLFLLPLASAVKLGSGTILNTTGSNSSMTFADLDLFTTSANISSLGIYLDSVSYTRGSLILNITTQINWTQNNALLTSGQFPKLEVSNDTYKSISSNLPYTISSTIKVPFTQSCSYLNQINYTTVGSTQTTYTGVNAQNLCSGTQLTFIATDIEANITAGTTNTITISWNGSSTDTSLQNNAACSILDFKCIFVNEIIGNPVIAILVICIFYFLVAYFLSFGFDTTITFFIPFLAGLGLVVTGFPVIYAFATIIVGMFLAWGIIKLLGNR